MIYLSDPNCSLNSIAAQRRSIRSVAYMMLSSGWYRPTMDSPYYSGTGQCAYATLQKAKWWGGCTPLLTDKPRHIWIGVWDTGPGIAEEQSVKYSRSLSAVLYLTVGWARAWQGLAIDTADDRPARLPSAHALFRGIGRSCRFMIEVPIHWPTQESWQRLCSTVPLKTKAIRFCAGQHRTILEGWNVTWLTMGLSSV